MKLKYEDRNPFDGLIEGEPWFFLRARDLFSHAALDGYHTMLCEFNRVAPGEPLAQNIKEIEHIMELFSNWQAENQGYVRWPKAAQGEE